VFIVLIRTVILYLLIVVGVRLLGKRQIGQLEPSELVLALIIADLASVPMQDNGIPLLSGVIPIVTLLAVSTILSVLTVRSIKFRALLCGRPSIVVENGVVQERELRKNRLTIDELLEELRGQGYGDFQAVKFAVLETNGRLSVLPFASEKPVTAAQMGLSPDEPGLPVILISDGRLLAHNLKGRGYETVWLHKQLAKYGLKTPEQAFLLTVDEGGNTYCVPKEGAK
jgi:uncharacterized membrane protein YcaP (DUF421 family)